ncbi:MAG: HEAT repeat domain-containing protein [Planctomycetota bacterium]
MRYHLKTTVAALALAMLTAAQGQDPNVNAAPAGVLRALIDPPASDAAPDDAEPSIGEMKRAIDALVSSGQPERVKTLGESAGPALRAMVEESRLEALAQEWDGNPLKLFVTYAPMEALQFFQKAEQGQRYRYDVILRGPYSIDSLMWTPVAQGESRVALQGLLDRAMASETLDLETKMRLATGAFRYDVATDASNGFIESNAVEAVRQSSRWAQRVHRILVPEGTAPTADLEPRIAKALLDVRPEIENLTPLSKSPDAEVRAKVAEQIRDHWSDGHLPPGPTVDIVTRLVRDESNEVVSWAINAAMRIVDSSSTSLSIEEMTRLTAAVADRPTDPYGLSSTFAQAIHQAAVRTPESEAAKVGELYRTVFASRLKDLPAQLRNYNGTGRGMPLANAIAYFDATAPLAESYRQAAIDIVRGQISGLKEGSTRRADATLGVLLKDTTGGDLSSRFLKSIEIGSSSSDRRDSRHRSLSAISADRIPEALRWITTTENRVTDLYEIALSSSREWHRAAPAVREIADSPSEATRTRVFAHGILLRSPGATRADADRAAAYFGECAADPAMLAEVDAYLLPKREVDLGTTPRLYMRVTRRLVEDERIPNKLATRLWLVGAPETPEEREDFEAALDAAEARAAAAPDGLEFEGMYYYALKEMAVSDSPVRESLLAGWLLQKRYPRSEAITVILGLDDNEQWLAVALEDLLLKLRAETSQVRQRTLVDQILRLPGDEPMQRMLEYVMRSDSTELVKYVEGVVNDRLKIREASLRWSKLASGGGSVDSAKVRLMRLLKDDDQRVRAAAIRALGTLGAVEAIPDLVELVGSDEEPIRAAATETLDLLYRQAAARVTSDATAPK